MIEEPDPKYRPPVEKRWLDGMREHPVRIELRTCWLYSENRPPKILVPAGRSTHPFSRSGDVTRSDVPSAYEHMQSLQSHMHRAVAAFGDDKDLIIEVSLVDDADRIEILEGLRELRSNSRHNADEVALLDRAIARLDPRAAARGEAAGAASGA